MVGRGVRAAAPARMIWVMTTTPVTTTWDADFETTLRGFLPFLDPSEALTADTSLRDYGLDSISTVGLLAELEERYGVTFPEEALDLANFETPGILWATLQSARG